jgi:hypothetical protein
MAVFVSVTTYISYGKISQFLASNEHSKNMLFKSGSFSPIQKLARLIYIVRKSVEWNNARDSSDETLNDTALYLYALCGKYINQAKTIINNTGGEIVNPSTGNAATIVAVFVQFRVGDVGSPMVAGETVLTLNYTDILNGSAEVVLDGVSLPVNDSLQISFIPAYGVGSTTITFNAAVQDGQLYQVHALRYVSN